MATSNRYHSPAARYEVSDDDFDEHGVLRDGHSFRVPVTLMDGMQRSVLRDGVCVTDAGGGGHRPGFRVQGVEDGSASRSDLLGHQTNLARAKMYQDYDFEVSTRWNVDADTGLPRGTPYVSSTAKAGQSCMINGFPGTLQVRQGPDGQSGLFCVANDAKADSAESRAEMYRMYDQRKAKEYLDPDEDEDYPVEAAFKQTQAYSNGPNRSAPASDGRTIKQLIQDKERIMQAEYSAYDEQIRAAHKKSW
jgi:hypothetical protein